MAEPRPERTSAGSKPRGSRSTLSASSTASGLALIPSDLQGRTEVVPWCFAAVSTVGTTLVCMNFVDVFDRDQTAPNLHAAVWQLAGRWARDVELERSREKTRLCSPKRTHR